MFRSFYLVTFLGLSCGVGFVCPCFQAAEMGVKSPTRNISTPSTGKIPEATPTTKENDKGQIAAWMIEASQVAKDYVEGLDKGHYAQSWNKGDPMFQHIMSQKEWTTALELSRQHLGKMKSRTLKNQSIISDPKGLPAGSYIVLEYNTSFEKSPQGLELLTLRRGFDGKWRVLTYNVSG